MAKAAEWYLRRLSNNASKPSRHLVFSGSTGCGKTHLARRIYRFVESYGVDLLFLHRKDHWSSLWIDWPRAAEADDERDFEEIMFEFGKVRFVVIDDIGSEADRFKNGVGTSRLRRILSLIEDKWVVMTTNLSKNKLVEAYDARSADRLRSAYWVDVGVAESYRGK